VKYRYDPTGRRSFNQPFGGQGQMQDPGMFPGISDSWFGGGNNNAGFNSPVPFQQFQSNTPSIQIQPAFGEVVPLPEQQFGQVAAPAKSGSSFSLNDLKGLVDRMGGIDGIVATMTKVQKVVSSVSQMAPLIKVLAGSLGKKGAAATIAEDATAVPRPRKRRRRTGSGAGVTPGGQRRRTRPRKR
jgi:hypothetical protein